MQIQRSATRRLAVVDFGVPRSLATTLKSLRKNVFSFLLSRSPICLQTNIIIEIVLDRIKRPENYTVMPDPPSATVIASVRQSSWELCLAKQGRLSLFFHFISSNMEQ